MYVRLLIVRSPGAQIESSSEVAVGFWQMWLELEWKKGVEQMAVD